MAASTYRPDAGSFASRSSRTATQPIAAPRAAPPTSSTMISPTVSTGESSVPRPSDMAVAVATSSTIGASLKPDSASITARNRGGSGTLRITEKMAAASVGDMIAPSRIALASGMPRTKWANAATAATEIPTPTVASRMAIGNAPRISCHFVVKPPSARISTSAANPSECARSASSRCRPSSPTSTPSPRKSSSEGSPNRAPSRVARMEASRTTEPSSKT